MTKNRHLSLQERFELSQGIRTGRQAYREGQPHVSKHELDPYGGEKGWMWRQGFDSGYDRIPLPTFLP